MPSNPLAGVANQLACRELRPFTPVLANEVYARSGIVIREFGEAEGDDSEFCNKLGWCVAPSMLSVD